MTQRVVNQRLLNDGSGRVCIHMFVRDEAGPCVNPSSKQGQGAIGYIACNKQQNSVTPQMRNGETLVCTFSDDARAVTCPGCVASDEYRGQMAELNSIVSSAAAFAA